MTQHQHTVRNFMYKGYPVSTMTYFKTFIDTVCYYYYTKGRQVVHANKNPKANKSSKSKGGNSYRHRLNCEKCKTLILNWINGD